MLFLEDIRTAVRNNGGGHANHTFFWEIMAPNALVANQQVKLKKLLTKHSVVLTNLKQILLCGTATGRFGSVGHG